MTRRVLTSLVVLSVMLISSGLRSEIYPPGPGVEYPKAYLERVRNDKTAFQFQKAWFAKTERARQNRMEIAESARALDVYTDNDLRLLLSGRPMETAVTGTAQVPLFVVKFSNTGADPYPSGNLQTELFDGPWPTGTMSEYYDEISYGNFALDGTVYNWFTLPNIDTYYEGTENGLGSDSKVGALILSTLNNWDPSVNFAQYDNDGPDGVPNSGDDDGYVDFVSFVHPEIGGECGNTNIWSHRWVVTGWPEFSSPYTTNDARYGGGYIRIYDYTIQPALSCSGTMIEIGVFCHEFGHAFGLPDLYDTNGGSAGIGHWGVMGSGSWNKPASPAHMCAWSKAQLGWIIPIEVGPSPVSYSLNNAEFNAEAYRLNIMEEKWRRISECAIAGSYSMHCGLTAAEAAARSWPGGAGYGNGWNESVSREFTFNGAGAVTFAYGYNFSSELNYDYTRVYLVANGVSTLLRTHHGTGSGTASISLAPYLSGVSSYSILFRFTSDSGWSDEDGSYDSSCGGAFTFDNVTLTGGGENYSTDFETYEDGWHVDMSEPSEYILVENRRAIGFDAFLHGSGLVISHCDDYVMNGIGNTGGESGTMPHGVAIMEADGLGHLASNTNRGDGGDCYPGTSSNTLFDNASTPNSLSYNGNATNVSVSSISAPGDPMTATMSGGWFPPTLASMTPGYGYTDGGTIAVGSIIGTGFNHGASFRLVHDSHPDIASAAVYWRGHARLEGSIDLSGSSAGLYDLVVENPDGQTVVLENAFEVIDTTTTDSETPGAPGRFALMQNYPNPFNPSTTISFDIAVERRVTLNVYDVGGRLVRTLVSGTLAPRNYNVVWDGKNDGGSAVSSGVYFYRLQAGDFTSVKKLVLLR